MNPKPQDDPRSEFRERVLGRDRHKCVRCGKPAAAVHHILERKLWPDGGYLADNGASLCDACHLDAERTILSCGEIRRLAGIRTVVVPPGMDASRDYDKWGNEMLPDGTRARGPLFGSDQFQKAAKSARILHMFVDSGHQGLA